MAKNTDSLFLFEVLVDKVIFSKIPCFFDRDFKTCINIKCPAIEPLEICDEDTSNFPDSKGPFLKVFSSGKSCLFFLKENEISSCTSSFPVKVSIYKALPCGCLPTKIIMGECTIDMTKEFMESRQKFLANPKDVSYQALKDSFRFVGPDGTETGEILMFLRISCFGNNIVTQFQGTNHASLGDSVVDRSCDPRNEFQSKEDPCACGATHGLKTGKHDACPPAEDKYNSMPCEEPEDPCYCSGPRAQKKQDLGCRNTFPYCLHVPKGPSKEYEEIGSNVNGNELKIRVPAGASIIKKISQTHCTLQRPYSKRKDDGLCDPPCGMNQISLALPNEAICCSGAQPTGTHFSCTTEGCLQAKHHAQALARGDIKRQEIPNKDVFVLKIAKTATEGDRKCHTELELTTPKGPDTNETTVKTNTAIQSDLDCECRVTRLKRIKNKRKSKCK
ncbi:uncharacterized protein LOC121738808 isoform X2 [Aricia agestis]|uniref:uncharacterized protein LOC121738808 isoform X2 n=1 Tax=Aricia agestis TaxID=91739 RepID=UPI001C2044DA|nr:uncharacterized protein LOC121738808 isoform X2 [Aricia agestis]